MKPHTQSLYPKPTSEYKSNGRICISSKKKVLQADSFIKRKPLDMKPL